MLSLLNIEVAGSARNCNEPFIDYSQSLLLTSKEYLSAMQEKANCRNRALREVEECRCKVQ